MHQILEHPVLALLHILGTTIKWQVFLHNHLGVKENQIVAPMTTYSHSLTPPFSPLAEITSNLPLISGSLYNVVFNLQIQDIITGKWWQLPKPGWLINHWVYTLYYITVTRQICLWWTVKSNTELMVHEIIRKMTMAWQKSNENVGIRQTLTLPCTMLNGWRKNDGQSENTPGWSRYTREFHKTWTCPAVTDFDKVVWNLTPCSTTFCTLANTQ